MDREHSWEVPRIECLVDFENEAIPICSIHWKLTTKNTDGFVYTAIHNGSVVASISPSDAFSLSKEDALTLLLSTLGSRVVDIENENASTLDSMIIPVVITVA